MLAHHLIHERLRRGRLVCFVMTVTAIAHEINDDVLLEARAIIEREARHEDAGLRVVPVHVEDRRFDHLRHIRAIQRRARIARIRRREAHLVVDDDVNSAAGVETTRLRELQRFHHDTLTTEGRVAVDDDGQHTLTGVITAAFLTRAHRAFDDGIHDFQMRRVESEHDVHIASRRAQIGREALVVLHVTRPTQMRQIVVAFELREEIARRLTQ